MELRQIRYFVALFEEGSVTAASRRLNVVQPTVSMQIAKLEEELGHQLFRRLPKGMVPTHAGTVAYQHFSRVLLDIGAAREHLSGLGDKIAGHVSVGVIASVSNNALSDCLRTFCPAYPDVSLRITGGYTVEFQEMVRNGTLEIAIINAPRKRTNLATTPIAREELVLAAASSNPVGQGGSIDFRTIAQLKLAIPSPRHGLRGIIDDAAAEAGITLEPSLEFDELKTIEEFVAASDYVTIIPPIAIHRALTRGLISVRSIAPRVVRDIVAIHSPNRGLSQAAKLFLQELKQAIDRSMINFDDR